MTPGDATAGRLVARVLRAAGVDAAFGAPLPGLGAVPVAPPGVAALLAAAHARVHGLPAALVGADGTIAVGEPGSDPVEPLVVATAADAAAIVGPLAAAVAAGTAAVVHLHLDPRSPVPDVALPAPPTTDRWVEPGDDVVAAVRSAESPVVLAGPGVVRDGAVPGLHALAAAAHLGVLNTWGAKGVYDWRSRHHLATAGLQARDFALGGLGDADLIVATGVDPAESGGDAWRLAPAVEVAPGALDRLSERWSRPAAPIAVPPLRAALAAVTQEGWASTASPLAPTLVTRHYGQVFGAGGLVAADPGVAGYWVARTFATTTLGGVVVPAESGRPGFAVACAAVARLRRPERPVLAVTDGPLPAAAVEVLDAARSLGVAVPVEVWDLGARPLAPDEHLAALAAAAHADRPAVTAVATDPGQMARMVDAAGPVTAWGGLPVGS
jgi:thiamine pyrophosphate-dependent acetolactate synthase large subunit-like protein